MLLCSHWSTEEMCVVPPLGAFCVLFLGCCRVIDEPGDADGGGGVGVTTLQITGNCQNEKLKC